MNRNSHMPYSAMERFNDALLGRPKDHVPIFPLISGWAAANFSDSPLSKLALDPKAIVDLQIRAKESMGYDALWAYADPLYIPEAFGCGVRFLETGPLVDPLPMTVTSMEDIDGLPSPDARREGRLPVILEAVKDLSEYSGGDLPVLGLFEGPFTTTCRILEPELIMRMVYKNRATLEALLDKVTAFLLQFAKALIENGANAIFLPEPTASASMISPSMFNQFVLPRLKKVTQNLTVPCILHICGDTSPTLKDMGECGAKVLSLDQCMDLSISRAVVQDAVLGGNVDPINALLMGSKEQVVNDTLNCLQSAGTKRFVLMSGCSVPPNTPLENVEIMIKTAKEYGLGP
jgi:MtaA/CmuA family methyltransferase